ncbi:MAG: hypothetical protein U5S82_11990 [Gammaproteobacteria bacterium]|nr:hypothetical protein [Gammaproteobacteria bacterium]
MEKANDPYYELDAVVENLAAACASNERRLRRTEGLLRWTTGGLVLALVLLLYDNTASLMGQAHAEARETPLQEMERDIKKDAGDEVAKVERATDDARAGFEGRMKALKGRLAGLEADAMEPGHAIAVILHDLKETLEVMPRIGADMDRIASIMDQMNVKMNGVPVMAGEMQQMNHKMGIMTYGVDSTMGRMGRMMPW